MKVETFEEDGVLMVKMKWKDFLKFQEINDSAKYSSEVQYRRKLILDNLEELKEKAEANGTTLFREIRKFLNLSQSDVAKEIKSGQNTLSLIENGKYHLKTDRISSTYNRIAEMLGMQVHEIFDVTALQLKEIQNEKV